MVNIGGKTLGFLAKYTEVAEAVLCLLAVWAGTYGARTRVIGKGAVVYASVEDAAKVFRALFAGDVLEYATALANSWSGLAGSHAPKLISLLALAQLLGVVEGKWAELWLAYKAATATTPQEVAKVLEGLFAKVEVVDKVEWTEGVVNLYFKLRGLKGAEGAVTLRLYTDFVNFRLFCGSCGGEVTARKVLEALAEELRPAVEQLERRLRLAAEEQKWPTWEGNALDLPAGVGWPMFLRLWARRNISFSIERDGRELLRVEVLEAGADGTAKFRLWYHRWDKTRPDKPYVDFKLTYKGKGQGFRGYVSANEAKGIPKDHLAEIAQLLKDKGVEGVSLITRGKVLQFTGAFRDSVLAKLDIRLELSRGKPPTVKYLGNYRFKIGDREVEFSRGYVKGGYEFYAELKFSSRDEAERFASSLKAVGVYAKVVGSEAAGYMVELDSDSFFGLLAATNATPPGLKPLYRSDDFRVYASTEGGRMRFYFAVRHGGVWRAVEGLYREKDIVLISAEHDVLEAVRGAVAKALEKLGRPADVGEPKEERDEKGDVEAYYLYLYGPHLAAFLEHAAEHVRAEPAEVRLEDKHIVISVGDVKAEVEFKLLKGSEAEFLLAQDVERTLAHYKSLREVGVPVEIAPRGVKVCREALWALVTTAVEKAIERGALSGLPAEVMPGVELLKVHSAGGMKLYIFRAEGAHYQFAVKTGQGWRIAGGKQSDRRVIIHGEAARAVADAINVLYRERGVERGIKVKYHKNGVPYILLTNVDLELLGLTRRESQIAARVRQAG